MKRFIYEDELPKDISKYEYDEWYKKSWVDVVRMGPRTHFTSKKCWCNPRLIYEYPKNGGQVWEHYDHN